jgi:hypothetical protein
MINLVIAGAVQGDAVFSVNLAFHFRRNVTHLSAVFGYADILHRNVECIPPAVSFGSRTIGVPFCGGANLLKSALRLMSSTGCVLMRSMLTKW